VLSDQKIPPNIVTIEPPVAENSDGTAEKFGEFEIDGDDPDIKPQVEVLQVPGILSNIEYPSLIEMTTATAPTGPMGTTHSI